MKMYKCKDCGELKEESFFYKNSKKLCKKCTCIKVSIYRNREDLKDKISNYRKEYRLKYNESDLEEKKKKDKEYAAEYHKRDDVKERRAVLRKKKRNENNIYKLTSNIRALVYNAIKRKGYKKSAKTHDIIGCSYEEFILYLESKFEDWMSWDNYGKYNGELYYGWDIDHIIPSTSANTEDEIYMLNHYTNLQPLCSKINRDIKIDKLYF